jgi:carbon storage regulator
VLVLTRKVGEEIVIGGLIRIKIVSHKGDRIRVGIEAPADIPVNRIDVLPLHRRQPPADSGTMVAEVVARHEQPAVTLDGCP